MWGGFCQCQISVVHLLSPANTGCSFLAACFKLFFRPVRTRHPRSQQDQNLPAFRMECPADADRVFGPAIQGCRSDFDFTLLFQDSVLGILPSSVLIILAAARLVFLARRHAVASLKWLYHSKIVSSWRFRRWGINQVGAGGLTNAGLQHSVICTATHHLGPKMPHPRPGNQRGHPLGDSRTGRDVCSIPPLCSGAQEISSPIVPHRCLFVHLCLDGSHPRKDVLSQEANGGRFHHSCQLLCKVCALDPGRAKEDPPLRLRWLPQKSSIRGPGGTDQPDLLPLAEQAIFDWIQARFHHHGS